MSKKKIFLTRKNQGLIKRLVLLDGFSGSGKSLLGAVLSHLAKSEQWQIDYFYEQIAILNYLHKIPFKSIKALCEVKSSETLYNLFIGRNVNFRPTDDSSPLKNGLRKKYIKRLKNKDKNFALKDILNSNPILILHLHYIFGYSKMLMKVFQKNLSLYILMLRNPFYLIDYWYSRKFTSVVGKSKIDFGMCVEAKGKVIPWYTTEYSSLYLKANNLEKSILTIFEMYKRISNMSNKLNAKEKKKLQVVFF
jgi:hypothetical protein